MIDLKIYAPKAVSTKRLRRDLKEILAQNHASFISSEASLSLYGYSVQQSWQYSARDRRLNNIGKLIVLTNDFNYFEEYFPFIPGGKIWYSAKVTFTDFEFNSSDFRRLKFSLDYLNNIYTHVKDRFWQF